MSEDVLESWILNDRDELAAALLQWGIYHLLLKVFQSLQKLPLNIIN